MGWGKYLGLLGGIGGGLATGAIGKHGIDPKWLARLGGIGGGMALGGAFGGHHGNDGGGNPNMGQMQQGGADMARPAMPQAMPGQMSAGASPMQPVQMGAPTAPTSFGQPGMFGGQPGVDPRQARMDMYRKWQMINGGGY